jgi:hypothetical protein
MKNIQKFSRYEFKYILNKKKADLIESESKYFMNYDENVDHKLDNRYFVRSLYFDNEFFSNFYEKVDGMKLRKKYRLRTYSKLFSDQNIIFLEMKGRINQHTYKMRTKINPKHLKFFYNKLKYSKLIDLYKNNEVINNFVFDSYKKNIFPCVLIDYRRRPYINKTGLNFRLTFDSNILSSNTNKLHDNNNQFSWQECRAGYTVLEVKFERSITPWFHRIIQNYDLERLSVSKFVIGMEQSNRVSDTSL